MTTTALSPAMQTLMDNSKPVKMNPILRRVNGVGFMFAGVGLRNHDIGAEYFVRMHWFTVFFVPLIPCGIYLLSQPVDAKGRTKGGSYFIHRAVKVKAVNDIWGFSQLLWLFVSGWVIAAVIIGVIAAIAAAAGQFH